jgi:dTDP-4-dehydrorhamnose reductase
LRILVTGASGLLGLNLASEAAKSHVVFGQVNRHSIRPKSFAVLHSDLLSPGAVESLLEETQPDWVVHCAALANLDVCEADPALAEQLNSILPGKLAAHVARGGARLVHISTDAVFDGQRGDYSESDLPNPLSIYAHTKLAGERAVADCNPDALIVRVNFYGWSLSGKRSLAEFFFYNLQAGTPIMGFTDVYFCPLLANHLAYILLAMLEKKLKGLFHVVCRQSTSKYDFGVSLARKFGLDKRLITPTSVAQAGLTANRSPRLTLRTDKLAQALEEPPPDLSTGLEHFYTLYQQGYPQEIRNLG